LQGYELVVAPNEGLPVRSDTGRATSEEVVPAYQAFPSGLALALGRPFWSLDKNGLLCKPICTVNHPVPSRDDPQNLLSATRDLTRRALLTTGWALWADAHPAFLAETLHLGSSQPTDLLYRIASPAGAIGLALLLLARIERSWLLLTLTVVYFIVTVAPVHLGQIAHPSP